MPHNPRARRNLEGLLGLFSRPLRRPVQNADLLTGALTSKPGLAAPVGALPKPPSTILSSGTPTLSATALKRKRRNLDRRLKDLAGLSARGAISGAEFKRAVGAQTRTARAAGVLPS